MSKDTRRVVVFAGRFTATRNQTFVALDYLFNDPDVYATDVLMTEVSPDRFREILSDYCRSRGIHLWHPKRPGADECAIMSLDRLRFKGYEQLTNLRIKIGRTDPIHLITAKVHKGPWLSIWHTAAHNFGLREGVWATTIYYSTLKPFRAWLRKRSKARKGAGAGGDYNVGLERQDMQNLLLENTDGFKFTQEIGGHRQIVGFATNMTVVEPARELELLDGFDHAPVLSVVRTLA